MSAEPRSGFSSADYQAALATLPTRCAPLAERGRVWCYSGLFALLLSGAASLHAFRHERVGYMLSAYCLLLIVPLLAYRVLRAMYSLPAQQRTLLAQRLASSDLAGRLRRRELEDDPIFSHVPAYARRLLPGWQGDSAEHLLHRLGFYLNWYLERPRPLFTAAQLIPGLLGRYGPFIFWLPAALLLWLGRAGRMDAVGGAALVLLGGWLAILTLRSGIYSLVIPLQCEALLEYIRREDALPGAELKDPESGTEEAGSGPAIENSGSGTRELAGLHLLLNEFERDLLTASAGRADHGLLIYQTLIISSLVLAACWYLHLYLFILLPVLFAVIAAFVVALRREEARQRLAARQRYEQSSLLLGIASGALTADSIEQDPLPGLRVQGKLRMPRGYVDDLRRLLWRIAHNADWYLGRSGCPAEPERGGVWLDALLVIAIVASIPAVALLQAGYFGGLIVSLGLAFVLVLTGLSLWRGTRRSLRQRELLLAFTPFIRERLNYDEAA